MLPKRNGLEPRYLVNAHENVASASFMDTVDGQNPEPQTMGIMVYSL